jgi:heme/copper-type cytochrome/quinol oxidase subunit 2
VDSAQAQALAYCIAVGLLLLGGYFTRQQVLALRRLAGQTELAPPERSYQRTQAWLRLVCSVVMLVLAGMVAWTYASGMEERASQLGRLMQEQRQQGEEPLLDADQMRFRKLWAGYWIMVLLLLLLILVLAGIDLIMIYRFRRSQLRQIDADRREMIQEQVAILRSQRNGHQEHN